MSEYEPSIEEQQAEQEARQERQQQLFEMQDEQERRDINKLAQMPEFRRFLWWIMKKSFYGPEDCPHEDKFNIGKWLGARSLGNKIAEKLLTEQPLLYTLMQNEAHERAMREKEFLK